MYNVYIYNMSLCKYIYIYLYTYIYLIDLILCIHIFKLIIVVSKKLTQQKWWYDIDITSNTYLKVMSKSSKRNIYQHLGKHVGRCEKNKKEMGKLGEIGCGIWNKLVQHVETCGMPCRRIMENVVENYETRENIELQLDSNGIQATIMRGIDIEIEVGKPTSIRHLSCFFTSGVDHYHISCSLIWL